VLPPFLSAHLLELRVLLLQLSRAEGIWPACALYNINTIIKLILTIITIIITIMIIIKSRFPAQ